MSVAFSTNVGRGSRRLLAQCAAMGLWERSPVQDQLEQQLGRDLAHKLVFGLIGPQAGRLGSSSP
jgi:hypothetical protein